MQMQAQTTQLQAQELAIHAAASASSALLVTRTRPVKVLRLLHPLSSCRPYRRGFDDLPGRAQLFCDRRTQSTMQSGRGSVGAAIRVIDLAERVRLGSLVRVWPRLPAEAAPPHPTCSPEAPHVEEPTGRPPVELRTATGTITHATWLRPGSIWPSLRPVEYIAVVLPPSSILGVLVSPDLAIKFEIRDTEMRAARLFVGSPHGTRYTRSESGRALRKREEVACSTTYRY